MALDSTAHLAGMQGYIKAVQTEQASSSSSGRMDVQTSWVSVANVSFADMLHAVEQKSLPERREPAQIAPAAPASELSARLTLAPPDMKMPELA